MSYINWKAIKLSPLKIRLDHLNPRVLLTNEECTQENMREYLLDYFEVIDLAKSIILNGGLPPTEKILCIKENDKYIVVEGNRRLTALQLLINPELIPEKHRNFFPIAPKDLKRSLISQEIALAPSRDSTEGYITLRHSGDNTKPWSRLAQNRRIILRYENENQTILHIAKTLQLSRANITKGIQFYYFIQYLIEELDWTKDELKIIQSPLLQTTKIDRFLPFGNNAKNIMHISFDENHRVKTKVQKEYFDRALKLITRKIFITDEINTRSTLKSVFNEEIKELCSHLKENSTENKGNEKEPNIVTPPRPETKNETKPKTKQKTKPKTKQKPVNQYKIILELKRNKEKVKRYNDFDLLGLIKLASDTNNADLIKHVRFNSSDGSIINGNILSGDTPDGTYNIQAKISFNDYEVSRSIQIIVYTPVSKIPTGDAKNTLFTAVTAFTLEDSSNIIIDINPTVNRLIEEMQSIEDTQNYHFMIASSTRQLIELTVADVINRKNLTNHGNTKDNFIHLINKHFTDKRLFSQICAGENKLKFEATKNAISSIHADKLYDYLNLITHDSGFSIYNELDEKINKQITPFLLVMNNYLKLS